jgi:hypothetical protein
MFHASPALMGMLMGHRHVEVSAFEVLNTLGATTVVATLVTRVVARALLRRHGLLPGQLPIALA